MLSARHVNILRLPRVCPCRVNGIVPGYKGFVPGAIDKHGGSHFGGVKGVGADGLNTIAAKVPPPTPTHHSLAPFNLLY